MTSQESEAVFSEAQQERIRQLIEANRPPPSSTTDTSSSQVQPTMTTTAVTTSSPAGNLGKLIVQYDTCAVDVNIRKREAVYPKILWKRQGSSC